MHIDSFYDFTVLVAVGVSVMLGVLSLGTMRAGFWRNHKTLVIPMTLTVSIGAWLGLNLDYQHAIVQFGYSGFRFLTSMPVLAACFAFLALFRTDQNVRDDEVEG